MKRIFFTAFILILLLVATMIPTSASLNAFQEERILYNNGNIYTVFNGPKNPTTFVLPRAALITTISTYHWNNARGARPGTIALRDSSGRVYGPWGATGSPGMYGVPNANWNAAANIRLNPGEYTVIDSDNSTWSHNAQSANAGFVMIKGYYGGDQPPPPPKPTPTPITSSKITALTENRSKHNVLIWVDGKAPKTPMDVLTYHLEPGWKGTLPVTIPANGQVTFVAGTGGQGPGSMYDKVITTCLWTGDPKDTKRYPHIIFGPGESLTCSTATKP